MTDITVENIWTRVCQLLQKQLNADIYTRWIAVIQPQRFENNALTLAVSNNFYQSWLEENYLPLIRDAARAISGCEVEILLEVHQQSAPPAADPEKSAEPVSAAKSASSHKAPVRADSRQVALNPKYTFPLFIVGPSNEHAHATSLVVAQAPGKAYNPLFIYGGTGLGKTHLMQAVGHYALTNSKARVQYLSCETLMNEYIDSLQTQRMKHFREKYRNTDLLLIDDIHFLTKTEKLQEEFFHTFNVLYDAHKQIVMTSDRPVSEIAGLEKRLVSRFEWGMVTELTAPDFETRLAILRSKQPVLKINLPEEVIVFIATHIQSNIRLLEGALIRLTSYAALYNQPITVEMTRKLLQSMLNHEHKEPVSITGIQKNVAEYFDVRLADMTSTQRSQSVALPRQVAMYLCRTLTSSSLPEIGMAFGKTHATVLHACRQINKRIETDTQLKQAVSRLTYKVDKSSVK